MEESVGGKPGKDAQTKGEQELQLDWNRVNKSAYWKYYKWWKKSVGMEEYWLEKESAGYLKEQWARLRCGSVSLEGGKGIRNKMCRLCKDEDEDLKNIWTCV